MKKAPRIALIIVSVILLIGIGGYIALWCMQASIAKDEITKSIERLNAGRKIVTYESISTAGFPTHVTVRVEKPIATIPVQDIVKPMGEQMAPAPDGTEQARLRKSLLEIPAWTETISLDGHIDFHVNALSDSYSVIPEGNYHIQSVINGDTKKYIYQVGTGARGCNINFARPQNAGFKLWNWDYLSGDPKKVLESLERIHCQVPEYQVQLEEGNTPVFVSKASNFLFEGKKNGPVKQYTINIALPEYEATEGLDALVEYYYQTMYPGEALPSKYKMAALGKQSFNAETFLSLNEAAPQTSPIIFAIRDFTYRSDLGETKMTADFNATPEGETGKANWNFHISSTANEKAYAKYLNDAMDLAHEIFDNSIAQGTQVPFTREEFAAQFQALVPKVHELGTFIFNFAGNGDLNAQKQINFILDALEFTVTPYGVKATGKGQMASPLSPVPQGEFNVACRNCMVLVDDVSAWFAKLIPLFAATPEAKNFEGFKVDTAIVEGIKDFIRNLDANATEDYNFAIIIDGKTEPSINGKPLTEVLALYQEKVGKLLQTDGTIDTTVSTTEDAAENPSETAEPTVKTAPTITPSTTPAPAPTPAKEAPIAVPSAAPAPSAAPVNDAPAAPVELKKPETVPTTNVQTPPPSVAPVSAPQPAKQPTAESANPTPKPAAKPAPKAAQPVKAPTVITPAPSVETILPGQGAVQ